MTRWARWSPRLALGAFLAYVVVAGPLLLFRLGNFYWFFQDDWDFISGRSLSSPHDLLLAHNQHWSTIPIVIWKMMWHLFGLHSYRPYEAMTVVCHLFLIVLIRVMMRRMGVGPWVASLCCAALVLYGVGEQSQLMAFQINFLLPAIFGVTQLMLVDHRGPWSRRDWAALGFGLLALMSSGLGVIIVAAVGVVVLVKRDWRTAALATVPLGVVFSLWFVAFNANSIDVVGYHQVLSPRRLIDWDILGMWSSVRGLATNNFGLTGAVAWALVILIIVGVACAVKRTGFACSPALVDRLLVAVVLFVAGVAFLTISGVGRLVIGLNAVKGGRYLYVATAFSMPLIAVAADEFVRRWRWSILGVVVLLGIGVPGNIEAYGSGFYGPGYFNAYRPIILGIASDPAAASLPRSAFPYRDLMPGPPARWLAEAHKAGKIPTAGPLTLAQTAEVQLRLAVIQDADRAPDRGCRTSPKGELVTPVNGAILGIRVTSPDPSIWPGSGISVSRLGPHGATWATVGYFSSNGGRFTVYESGLRLKFSAPGSTSITVCDR